METVVEVVGVNGDTVIIAGPDTGVDGVWLEEGFTGFFDPVVETSRKPVANRPGTKYLGFRMKERVMTFSVMIAGDDSPAGSWESRDERWRRLWAFGEYTTMRFTTDVSQRSIRVMLDEIEVDTRFDPRTSQATRVLMTVVADDPFYYGPEYTQSFTVQAGRFLQLAVQEANPGDVPAFTEWVLEAPGKWTLPDEDIPGRHTTHVDLPTLAAGEHLTVNTDPGARQLIAANNAPVWARMNGVRFRHPIPPHTRAHVFPVKCDRESSGQLRIKRRYLRPWGLS